MLEIACFEITSAELALQSVADRIEFCADVASGGTTPNIEEFRYLRSKYHKPIHVMIRPSGGPFFYNDNEFRQMQQDILQFKNAGADGFVFGILTHNQFIDQEKNQILVDLVGDKTAVFHRAIDRTPEIFEATKSLIKLGFKEVLTSGGKSTAVEGKDTLSKLITDFDDRIKILIGGGVRSSNILELMHVTKGTRYHSSAILPYESFVNVSEIKNIKKSIEE